MQHNAERNYGKCDGFDEYLGTRWIYPNNMPIRGYQKAAVELALFNNAMIVLPTGFGKTFIAAVVMYNFHRWYPQGKIIFVAPTRPLVAQQIQECKKVSGIPAAECVEFTGVTANEKRRVLWETKRVIFATPQTIENDLNNGSIPAESIRCIVIDEAHRAQNNYAYVNLVKHLHENNKDGFRVLALSATPGSDIQKVQQVMINLLINEVMFRSENSIDLMSYRNEKKSTAWTVELPKKHQELVDLYIKICDPVFKKLYKAGLTYNGDAVNKVARYTIVQASRKVYSNEVGGPGVVRGDLKFAVGAAGTMAHNFELLTLYGLRVFYSSLMRAMDDGKCIRCVFAPRPEYQKILDSIEGIFGDDIEPDPNKPSQRDLTQGHPKLSVVKDLLMKHFETNKDKAETRAIVFTKFRESVLDIVQTLKAFEPLLKPAMFVGQGSGPSKKKGDAGQLKTGMTQKEQIKLLQDFKAGVFNVLVATCVAEEGLDIGEVDLIICYDTSASPISTTQRRGRTGRKRSGDVQTILTKGYEEKKLKKAGASRRSVEDQLFKKENYVSFKYRMAPRMVPRGINPVCMEHTIVPIVEDVEEEKPKRKRGKRNETVDILVTESNGKKGKSGKSPGSAIKKSKGNKSFEDSFDTDSFNGTVNNNSFNSSQGNVDSDGNFVCWPSSDEEDDDFFTPKKAKNDCPT